MLIMSILKETEADDYQIFLTGSTNFRDTVAVTKPYKGNRDVTHKPHHYKSIKKYLVDTWQAEVVEGMEADDAMGMAQSEHYSVTDPSTGVMHGPYVTKDTCEECPIICSLDKDMKMIPGWHYNWRKKSKVFITEEEAIRHFWFQMLTGDPTDNIKGVPKIGEKTAIKLLDNTDPKDYAEMVVEQYYLGYYKHHFNKDMELFISNIDNIIKEHEQLLWIKRSVTEPSRLPVWL